MRTTVSIIGTAGRKSDANKLNAELFAKMVVQAKQTIETTWGLFPENVELVSGGAAWADHVAVRLFLNNPEYRIRLELPAAWEENQFADSGTKDWKQNHGRVANHYHSEFEKKSGIHSLEDIQVAKERDAVLNAHTKGFFARNAIVAKSEYLIAFTFGKNSQPPKDSGTLHTWKLAKAANKIHFDIDKL
jgi:hypothetical protein